MRDGLELPRTQHVAFFVAVTNSTPPAPRCRSSETSRDASEDWGCVCVPRSLAVETQAKQRYTVLCMCANVCSESGAIVTTRKFLFYVNLNGVPCRYQYGQSAMPHMCDRKCLQHSSVVSLAHPSRPRKRWRVKERARLITRLQRVRKKPRHAEKRSTKKIGVAI